MAYDYGVATGRSASEALQLPVAELIGYYAYMNAKRDMLDDA